MPPPKITGEKINCRVKLGSALERLLQGRDVTDTLHRMAELIEAAPPAVMAELPLRMGADGKLEGRMSLEPGAVHRVQMLGVAEPQMVLIGHGRDERYVTAEEALRLAAEQSPGGLQVVGFDEEEVFEEVPEVDQKVDQFVDDLEQSDDEIEPTNDLSHLV